jgi:hypothetical protein
MRFAVSCSLAALTLLSLSCSSSSSSGSMQTAQLIPPEFSIRQIGGQPSVARYQTGPISVQFEIEILNHSGEALTVDSVTVESIGHGAYTLRRTSVNFKETVIGPQRLGRIRLWAPAEAEGTIIGANGPVTVRGTVYFNSAAGKFREIFVQQVNADLTTAGRER